jgi:hypothetical protein
LGRHRFDAFCLLEGELLPILKPVVSGHRIDQPGCWSLIMNAARMANYLDFMLGAKPLITIE